ncbi:tripartite tricarboxylate transporter substrate binding protein [Hyphomicrobium sp. CS1BSMeth3]|uniref:Bug family tripartite tricarboxylate transporter substrate binding protein n=1 Tax=Hyphomicrobium sp. CS1BSMeth3 TaxID=1892844 RepID=UPI0009314C5B|nr:tripartite tricarboxylate transporter substrate binding protein [Hyphomicrobium sp. CS1BSMeth3]
MRLLRLAMAVTAVALVATHVSAPASAQQYPTRPINMIVSFPAGGSTDIGARVVAGLAEKILGQPIVVVNRGGAGGQVGWTELARAKPDGYTIGFLNLPATNTTILDPERQAIFNEGSFTPIANQVLDPGVIWVAANSPYKTLKDLLDAAKAKPGTIRAATTGILSDDHLAILMVEEVNPGVNFRIVHLLGGAAQMKETLGGNIDVSFDNVGGIVPQVKSGQVRALAVMDTERSKFLPDVPTTKELGMPTVISSSTRGIGGPKGMDPAVVKKLQDVFSQAMKDPDHVKRLEDAGLAIKIMVGDEYVKYYNETHEKAKKYTEWAKNRPQK